MPLDATTPDEIVLGSPQRPVAAGAPTSLSDQLEAALTIDNVAFSAIRAAKGEPTAPPEADFNPFDHLQPGEELIAYQFATARSQGEMAQVRARITNEREMRRRLGSGPIPELLASTVAVLTDPVSYIPFVGQGGKLPTAARIGRAALATGVEVGASELALQALQQERPIEESVAAIIMGGAFGGALAGTAAVRAGSRERAYKSATEDMTAVVRGAADETGTTYAPPASLGAAATARIDPEMTKLVSSGYVAETMAKLDGVRLAAPSLVLATSETAAAREAVHALVDTGMVTKGQVKGVPMTEEGPVELLIRRKVNTGVQESAVVLREAYRDLRASGGTMSRVEFNEAVGRAMSRGDEAPTPQVAKAAAELRLRVFEPLKKAATETKLLPEDVDIVGAVSYFTRVYNKEKISARRPEFRDRIERYLRDKIKSDEIASDAEYSMIADAIIDNIMGNSSGRVPMMKIPRARGPMKERTFNIPDGMIEDFLVKDAGRVTQFYVNTMVADIEMARLSQRLGFGGRPDDVGIELGNRIREEFKPKLEAAKTEAARETLNAKMNREIELVEGLTNMIRGTSKAPYDPAYQGMRRIGKVVRTLNYTRLLGSVLLSSIPDMGRIIAEEGLGRTFGTLLGDAMNGFKAIKLGRSEAQAAGTANEIFLATRVRAQLDLGDRYAAESAFERGLDTASQWFGIATLLTPWNEAAKSLTSTLVSTRILKTVTDLADGKQISDRARRKLAQAGISESMAKRIAAERDNFDVHDTAILAGTDQWKDRGAIEAFRSALIRDVDNTVITPGRGDAPLWTSTEWGKTIFQFKRFGAASTQRILVSALQQRDMAALNGILVMVALGGVATALRDVVSKGEVEERPTEKWVVNALDRSGAMSMFFEFDALMDKATGGNLSIQRAVAGEEATRFKSRDVVGQALGPTAGMVSDFATAVAGIADKDLTQSDMHKVRRLIPGQNLFYFRYMLDQVEKSMAETMGIPEKQPRQQSSTRQPALPGE